MTREFAGLTRTELAARSKIPYPVLANLETGRRRASDNMIEKIASGLSLDTGQTKTFRNLAESADGDIRIKSTFGTPYRTFVNEYLDDRTGGATAAPDMRPGAKPLQSESERLDPDSHTHASLDMLKLWQFLAGPPLSAGPDSPVERSISVGPPRRIRVLEQITTEIESMDEEDLLRVRAFLDGMRAAQNPPDTHE